VTGVERSAFTTDEYGQNLLTEAGEYLKQEEIL
jgi:hypothetical protein